MAHFGVDELPLLDRVVMLEVRDPLLRLLQLSQSSLSLGKLNFELLLQAVHVLAHFNC